MKKVTATFVFLWLIFFVNAQNSPIQFKGSAWRSGIIAMVSPTHDEYGFGADVIDSAGIVAHIDGLKRITVIDSLRTIKALLYLQLQQIENFNRSINTRSDGNFLRVGDQITIKKNN